MICVLPTIVIKTHVLKILDENKTTTTWQSDFFLINDNIFTKKHLKSTKKFKTAKKVFQPFFGCTKHLNAGQNTQQ